MTYWALVTLVSCAVVLILNIATIGSLEVAYVATLGSIIAVVVLTISLMHSHE